LTGAAHRDIGGDDHDMVSGPTELRFTLNGATPNRTFTLFITPSASAALPGNSSGIQLGVALSK
jgi:hypothetical protein